MAEEKSGVTEHEYAGRSKRKRRYQSNTNCSVLFCKSRYSKGDVSFHLFPKEKHLRQEWKRRLAMRKPVTDSMVVCSKHFTKDCYFFPDLECKKRRLKKGSFPSLNPLRTSKKEDEESEKKKKEAEAEKRKQSMLCDEKRKKNDDEEKELPFSLVKRHVFLRTRSPPPPPPLPPPAAHAQNFKVKQEVEEEEEEEEGEVCSAALCIPILQQPHLADAAVQVSPMDTLPTFSLLHLITRNFELNAFTGIRTFEALDAVAASVRRLFPVALNPRMTDNDIRARVILTAIKLKTDLSFDCLAVLFRFSAAKCRRIFKETLPFLKDNTKNGAFQEGEGEEKDNHGPPWEPEVTPHHTIVIKQEKNAE